MGQPAQPPAQHQFQDQNQSQKNGGDSTTYSTNAADLEQKVDSDNTNVISTEGSLSAVQINNFNAGELKLDGVGSKATPHLNVTAYTHDGNYGVAATLSLPLGGSRKFDQLAEQRLKNQQLAYAVELSAACNAMARNGISIENATNPDLVAYREACRGVESVDVRGQDFDARMQQLQLKMEQLAAQNAQLRRQLLQGQPQNQPPAAVPALW